MRCDDLRLHIYTYTDVFVGGFSFLSLSSQQLVHTIAQPSLIIYTRCIKSLLNHINDLFSQTYIYVDPETLPNCLIYICALFQKQKLFYIFTQLLKSWSTLSSSCTILRPIYSRQYIMHHHHHMIWNKICMIERKTQHICKRRYTWAWNSSSVVQDKHCMHACVAIIYW